MYYQAYILNSKVNFLAHLAKLKSKVLLTSPLNFSPFRRELKRTICLGEYDRTWAKQKIRSPKPPQFDDSQWVVAVKKGNSSVYINGKTGKVGWRKTYYLSRVSISSERQEQNYVSKTGFTKRRPAAHGPPHGPRPGGPRPGQYIYFFTSTSRWRVLNARDW